MSWEAPLRALVAAHYGAEPVDLRSIAHYAFDDRVICRVEFADRPPATLRALTGPVDEWLLRQAAALDHVRAHGFPALRVIRTTRGEPVAAHDGWSALLLTFVEGVEADFSPPALEALARSAAALHLLPAGDLPPSRLTPAPTLPTLEPDAGVPAAALELHRAAVQTMRRLDRIERLPAAVLHGDCWPANAIRTPDGGMALVDWEGAGSGPPVLELGYLLLGAHLGSPQLPTMRADEERIAAVVRGYASVRPPTEDELDVLPEAVRWDVVHRAVQSDAFARPPEHWRDDLWLRKSVARSAVASEIADIARAYLVRAGWGPASR
jgi:Ser/Thr protein kinase RdoA (MazF antagonist)